MSPSILLTIWCSLQIPKLVAWCPLHQRAQIQMEKLHSSTSTLLRPNISWIQESTPWHTRRYYRSTFFLWADLYTDYVLNLSQFSDIWFKSLYNDSSLVMKYWTHSYPSQSRGHHPAISSFRLRWNETSACYDISTERLCLRVTQELDVRGSSACIRRLLIKVSKSNKENIAPINAVWLLAGVVEFGVLGKTGYITAGNPNPWSALHQVDSVIVSLMSSVRDYQPPKCLSLYHQSVICIRTGKMLKMLQSHRWAEDLSFHTFLQANIDQQED